MHAVNATRSYVDFVLILHPAMFLPQAATGRKIAKIRSEYGFDTDFRNYY